MKILITYGSQTGNTEQISHTLFSIIEEENKEVEIYPMNYFSNNIEDINNYDYVIFLCSTTGNGEFPENAFQFWKNVKKRTLEKNTFESLKFSVCALGDTNYSMFCFSGKSLNRRLLQLGATEIMPIFCMDAVEDDEEEFEKYVNQLLPMLT